MGGWLVLPVSHPSKALLFMNTVVRDSGKTRWFCKEKCGDISFIFDAARQGNQEVHRRYSSEEHNPETNCCGSLWGTNESIWKNPARQDRYRKSQRVDLQDRGSLAKLTIQQNFQSKEILIPSLESLKQSLELIHFPCFLQFYCYVQISPAKSSFF